MASDRVWNSLSIYIFCLPFHLCAAANRWKLLTNIQDDREFQALPESMTSSKKKFFLRKNEFKKESSKATKNAAFWKLSIAVLSLSLNSFSINEYKKIAKYTRW